MEQKNTDSTTVLTNLASAATPYTSEELRVYDGDEDMDRMLATMAKYALEHPNPKLSEKEK